MVDTVDLFRRLSSGAKYDRRRLTRELAVFQGERVEGKGDEKSIAAALDFFGDSSAQEEEGLPPDITRKAGSTKLTLGKKKHSHHDVSSDGDQVGEEPTEVEGQSDDGEEESEGEEDVTLELLSGHTPLSWQKRKRKKKKGKRRKLDKETRAVLKRQELQS